MVGTCDSGGHTQWIELDPEPAVLDAQLGTTSGATAAAHYENTPEVTTTGVKFTGTNWASCTTSVTDKAGFPCTSAVGSLTNSGTELVKGLGKNGTMCRCN